MGMFSGGYYPRVKGDRPLEYRERDGSVRVIPAGGWAYDPTTPVGDDAFYYELFPHNGYEMLANHRIVDRHKPAFGLKPYPSKARDTSKCARCPHPLDDIEHAPPDGRASW